MSLIYKIFKLKTKSWIKNWIYNQEKAPTPILPTKYQQVDYIESSGTQYIDTGFTPTLNTKLKLKFNYLLASSTTMVFGCKSESSNYYQLYKGANDGRLTVSFGISDVNNSKAILTNFVNTDIDIEIDKNKIVLNGGDYGYTATPSVNGYNSLGLFARHNPSDWSLNSSIKMYYFKIYDNDTLVRDFIPCYRKSDEEVGLYDTVTKTFFTNQGTGVFTYGSTILPKEYQRVEYIKSSGTQYIDTGFKANNYTKYEIECMITNYNEYGTQVAGIIGAIDSFRSVIYIGNNNNLAAGYGNVYNNQVPSQLNKKYNLKLDKNKFYVDGQLVSTLTVAAFSLNINSYIFRRNNSSDTDLRLAVMKLYSCKIYDNDTLLRNFVPCYRKSDNEVGLYDVVNDVFYTNAGTGDFVKGGDV